MAMPRWLCAPTACPRAGRWGRPLRAPGVFTSIQIGKWHLGCLMPWMTPAGRGFDTSLGYLSGGEDHFTQFQKSINVFGCEGVDLYETDKPAIGKNGTYASYIYNAEIQRILTEREDTSVPLFMYVALQTMHAPQEVPDQFAALFPATKYDEDYAIMNGMGAIADEVFGNMTKTLRQLGMWNNTLIIMTSDSM